MKVHRDRLTFGRSSSRKAS